MGIITFIIIGLAIYFFWNNAKEKKISDTLSQLDRLGDVMGKRIGDIQTVLGAPNIRTGIDSQIVSFTWFIGKVTVVACWNKMDNEQIVSYQRTDRT